MSIAWDYLTDIEKAQLKHCCKFIRITTCQRCGGDVLLNYDEINCLQCGAEHDENGELLRPRNTDGINLHYGHTKRKGMRL